jgi:hypothetical protein
MNITGILNKQVEKSMKEYLTHPYCDMYRLCPVLYNHTGCVDIVWRYNQLVT